MTKLNCFNHRSTNVCKNTVKVKTTFCSNEFLLRKMGKSAARLLRQPILYLLWQCPRNISYSISFVCVRVRARVLGWLSQLVPQQQCEWLKTTPRCVYKMVRRPRNILLKAEVNEASNSNWKCEASWWQEVESMKQQVVLQDPASTAAKIHSNLTFSVWTWVQYTWSKKALTWLYIEDITSKHRVPAEPLHPACAMRRPAKRRVLTTQRARKTQYDFGGECHPDLQRIGNTEKARLLEVDVYLGCFNWRQRRIDCLMSITLLSSPQTALFRIFWPHSHTPTNHELTAHVAGKETLLIHCHCTLKGKTDKSWGQHLLQVVLSTGEDPQKAVEAHQAMKLQETHAKGTMFVGAASIWKAFPVNSKPPVPSCAKSHQNSTPVQMYATCMCLPKGKAKENRLPKQSCQGFWQQFGKGRMFRRPFFKTNPQELSTLCIYPKQLLNNTKNVSIKKKRCLSQILPNIFILQLRRNIPLTTMTLIVFCLENVHCKEMPQLLHRTWCGMILKGIFLSNFWNLYML